MGKFKWFICFMVALCLVCGVAFAGCTLGTHEHELTYYEAKAASEDEDGNTEYWYCEGCGKYFSDEDAETQISWSDILIPKTGSDSGSGSEGDNGSGSEGGSGSEEEGSGSGSGTEDNTGTGSEGDSNETSVSATITVNLPSTVSLKSSYSGYSSYNPEDGTITGTVDTAITLPTADELEISDDSSSTFGSRSLQGWYEQSKDETTGAITNTIITGTTYTPESESSTIAPYWNTPLGTTAYIFNKSSGGNGVNMNDNNISTSSGSTIDYRDYATSSNDAYTTVIDSPEISGCTAFNYALPAVTLSNANYSSTNRGVIAGDKIRVDTAVDNNIWANDNVFFYEFQNQGTENIYFKFCVVNTSTTPDSSYMYIYLAPGETVTYIISDEMANHYDSSTTNSNMMICMEAVKSASSMTLAVACGFLSSSSTTEHSGNFTTTDLSNQGFKIYTASKDATEGEYSNATYSESTFVAYVTTSTLGSLDSAANVYEIQGTVSTGTEGTEEDDEPSADTQTSSGSKG